MKFIANTLMLSLFIMSLSCKEVPEEKKPIASENDNSSILPKIETQCYLYAKNKDSIKLMIKENKTLVTGKMSYNFFEKDGSWGSFEGVMKGDTLYGDYDFEAEGTKSKREVVFLKKGNTFIEGFGDVEVDGQNTTVFKKGAKSHLMKSLR